MNAFDIERENSLARHLLSPASARPRRYPSAIERGSWERQAGKDNHGKKKHNNNKCSILEWTTDYLSLQQAFKMTPIEYEPSEGGPLMQSIDYSDDYDEKSIAKGGVTTPFPWKLHDMLDDMDRQGTHSVVTWQPHGRAFMVHQPKEFVDKIMPHYFNQTKASWRHCCLLFVA